jgi:3-hydroxyisobutyrate dehydrogenase-like beta-hydroxyacid dehydrogenase
MGGAVGAALTATGHTVQWASEGRSAETRERAERAGLSDAGTLEALARTSEILLSVCPPQFALDTAAAVSGFSGLYVDANAVAPASAASVAELVEAAGASYVDGGIIGPPPLEPGSTRLYLSGAGAPAVAELFAGSVLDAHVIGDERTAASAIKMAYAGWTKGSAALLLAMREAAERLGVGDELEAEWRLSQPGLAERYAAAAASREEKGWRWSPEMREIAATLEAAGLPAGFHEAAAEVFAEGDRV